MTGSQTRSLADAKSHLSELVARVGSPHVRLTITVRGRPAAVLVAVADLEALEETIAILADAAALDALAEADAELARGERKRLAQGLPESIAFAAYEFIVGASDIGESLPSGCSTAPPPTARSERITRRKIHNPIANGARRGGASGASGWQAGNGHGVGDVMSDDFEVVGQNADALFTLKLHRGEGALLLGMNWKDGEPPDDFVGFAIEYQAPGAARFNAVHNRLSFEEATAASDATFSSLVAPLQKFRWVHFPFEANLTGAFTYRVTPVFMAADDSLSQGAAQAADIVLAGETYPGQLNVAFTRGYVSSQAFVDRYQPDGPVNTLVPTTDPKFGLDFTPTHPDAQQALPWMGFEARSAIFDVLDAAIADESTTVQAVAYDFNEPEIVNRFKALGSRLTIIIDNSDHHGADDSAETRAAAQLGESAGADHVKRQHMGDLQHNKTIIVTGPALQKVVCGSTNFSWRGLYVQNNNAMVLTGASAIQPFLDAFAGYWASDHPADFGVTAAANWTNLGLPGIDADVAFSPHSADNALLAAIGADIANGTTADLFYSLAFLGQTRGPIRDAITQITERDDIFVYGIADTTVGGIDIRKPNGNLAPVSPSALNAHVPPPFQVEPTGGSGVRMHHKFVVIDFDKPTARVYVGSYNFSSPADRKNGENLLIIRDRRIATSYMVEAVRIFDHYEFRAKQQNAASARASLALQKPPRNPGEVAWWSEAYANPQKARDRLLFA